MIDNFEYTYLPKGKVIVCACDQAYFEFFFDKLYTSFTKNISEFNQLHIPVKFRRGLDFPNREEISTSIFQKYTIL